VVWVGANSKWGGTPSEMIPRMGSTRSMFLPFQLRLEAHGGGRVQARADFRRRAVPGGPSGRCGRLKRRRGRLSGVGDDSRR